MLTVLKWLGAGIVAGLSLFAAWRTDWLSGDTAAIATVFSIPALLGLRLWMFYERAKDIRDRRHLGDFQGPAVEHRMEDSDRRRDIESR